MPTYRMDACQKHTAIHDPMRTLFREVAKMTQLIIFVAICLYVPKILTTLAVILCITKR